MKGKYFNDENIVADWEALLFAKIEPDDDDDDDDGDDCDDDGDDDDSEGEDDGGNDKNMAANCPSKTFDVIWF